MSTGETPGLTGKQRKHLRGVAHALQPLVQVGREGVSDAVVDAVDVALSKHELVKVRLHEPEDKKGMAAELARRAKAELCGLVGHTVILYRADPEDPRVKLR